MLADLVFPVSRVLAAHGSAPISGLNTDSLFIIDTLSTTKRFQSIFRGDKSSQTRCWTGAEWLSGSISNWQYIGKCSGAEVHKLDAGEELRPSDCWEIDIKIDRVSDISTPVTGFFRWLSILGARVFTFIPPVIIGLFQLHRGTARLAMKIKTNRMD